MKLRNERTGSSAYRYARQEKLRIGMRPVLRSTGGGPASMDGALATLSGSFRARPGLSDGNA